MKFAEALEKIEGAQSAGGDLIVIHNGKHVLVGRHVQGNLIVADTDEARAVMAEVEGTAVAVSKDEPEPEPEPEPKTHEVQHHDSVETADRAPGSRRK